jgi:hypothetical protein
VRSTSPQVRRISYREGKSKDQPNIGFCCVIDDTPQSPEATAAARIEVGAPTSVPRPDRALVSGADDVAKWLGGREHCARRRVQIHQATHLAECITMERCRVSIA